MNPESLQASQPSAQASPPPFRHIVVAVDGSDASRSALAWARELAQDPHVRVSLLHVYASPMPLLLAGGSLALDHPAADVRRSEAARGRAILDEAREAIANAGNPPEAVLREGIPSLEIARFVEARQPDLLILGSHGYGPLSRLLLGSVADEVRERVPCHILIAKAPPDPSGRVLIALDPSPASREAARLGAALARQVGARAEALHVMGVPLHRSLADERARLEEALDILREGGRNNAPRLRIEFGDAADRLVEAARAGDFGLLAVGSRGLGPIGSLLLGSVSNAVSHRAPCSVLIAREVKR